MSVQAVASTTYSGDHAGMCQITQHDTWKALPSKSFANQIISSLYLNTTLHDPFNVSSARLDT